MASTSIAWTDPKILAALIAGGVSLLLGLTNLWLGRRNSESLERLKARLATKASQADARLEYEYSARLRLYQACAPVMFQLSNAAERARGRILSFALSTQNGDIGPDRNWLNRERHGYYWASSFYRLLAPAALAEILKRRLTHIDLSLDRHLHAQYELALAWADTFSRDFRFARMEPELPYDPHNGDDRNRKDQPRIFHQQGVPRGILENAATTLIEGEAESAALMPYGKFEPLVLGDEDNTVRPAILRISYLLDGFYPDVRPVLWRVLCAQFAIAEALIVLRDQRKTLADAQRHVEGLDPGSLDWLGDAPDAADRRKSIARDTEIGIDYAVGRIARVRKRLEDMPGA